MEANAFYKPQCKLIGENGNVFNIIGIVSRTLKDFGYEDKAVEFSIKAIRCENYDDVLQLVMEYVEVV